jgi:hypothetical protein
LIAPKLIYLIAGNPVCNADKDFYRLAMGRLKIGHEHCRNGYLLATFSLLPAMTITIVTPASIAIYAITLLCFKGIRENEIPMLMDLLALRKP